MSYDSVDALQRVLVEQVFHYAEDRKKAAGRAFLECKRLGEDIASMSAGRNINSQSQDWGTPANYVQAVSDFFDGEIDLDPCSNSYSLVKAHVQYRLPERDGLKETWHYKRVFVNPPYGLDRKRGTGINYVEVLIMRRSGGCFADAGGFR